MTKTKVIKIVQEEAEKIGIDLKKVISAKAGEKFKKAQDAEMQVHKRQHTKKLKRLTELNKKRVEQYMWTMSNRLKPEPITNVKIHPNSKPAVPKVYRNNDKKNFDVHNPFKFGDFGITELDELALSKSLKRKRKHMELEPETKNPGLECNRALLENVPFVNNMVIEEPELGIFFTNEFCDQAFQRWSDINKVGIDALVSYLVSASMVWSLEKARFNIKLKKLIVEHPDQEKLKSKKVIDTADGVCLSQRKYCLDLLSEFGLLACKPFTIPFEQNVSVTSEPSNLDPVIDNITEYQKLIGKLIYLTQTRHDIAYSVHYLSQFIHKPLKSHLKISLRVIRDCLDLKDFTRFKLGTFFPAKVCCDSQAAIKIAANPVLHERTKNLEIDLHFGVTGLVAFGEWLIPEGLKLPSLKVGPAI
ncbi:retrovirus-related pol polyprotein from transposon TNT 1-94 [Tanacetum coccineum]